MPKISVIVPVYNTEKYLHRFIDSILAQTFTDFELLLIDDGSKDGSGKICDEYAAKESSYSKIEGNLSFEYRVRYRLMKYEFLRKLVRMYYK